MEGRGFQGGKEVASADSPMIADLPLPDQSRTWMSIHPGERSLEVQLPVCKVKIYS